MEVENSVKGETRITAFDLGHKMIWIYTEKVDSSSLVILTEMGETKRDSSGKNILDLQQYYLADF